MDVKYHSSGSEHNDAYRGRDGGTSSRPWDGHHVSVATSITSAPRPMANQNARSFIHSSYCWQDNDYEAAQSPYYSSFGVREQTAELANRALSDAASVHSGTPIFTSFSVDSSRDYGKDNGQGSFRTKPNADNTSVAIDDSDDLLGAQRDRSHTMRSLRTLGSGRFEDRVQPSLQSHHTESETTSLIAKVSSSDSLHDPSADSPAKWRPHMDIDSGCASVSGWPNKIGGEAVWKRPSLWRNLVLNAASHIPAVILGLLLNVLDGLSYGMILFPLGESIFSDLGPDGLSMFYVSCIVSQLVYSCGGSRFRGGVGSEMIEVVPFFHKMAFTILQEVGTENPGSVLATTILSYSLSSVLTGAVFFFLGSLRLGTLIGFFPRHILVGCIGGVGWFLIATGLEVSARLNGNLQYNLETLALLFRPMTVALWGVPLALAFVLIICQRITKHALLMPLYFMAIPAVFYVVLALIPGLDLEKLRHGGWIFNLPTRDVPFWHFYTLYDFKIVNWKALMHTIPAMFALTFFGILHVPINVPALAVSTGEDNIDVDRELIAHGISNAFSGLAGSIQNYLVYSNSILFIRSGGDSRIAGVLLAIGTFGIMATGPVVIGYIPVMVVGALIFLLGMELLKEALYDTWGKLSRLEYLTICTIVITMGVWDFVIGILIGIVMACVSLVVSASRKSPIRVTYSGVVARSTVRRPPTQQHFLREIGRQTQVVKLAGYMFFGTIASVERWVRDLLEEQNFHEAPIRYLIVDFRHVTGLDFSAAEAFTRMRRLLSVRNVQMIISGVDSSSEVGQGLRSVGVWAETDVIQVFEDLNLALESCENEFLSALYSQNEGQTPKQSNASHLDVPGIAQTAREVGGIDGSPRRTLVHRAATTTLKQEAAHSSKWQNFRRPLPLILQVFQGMTDKNEDFWFQVVGYFRERKFSRGTLLFRPGDKASEFFLVEEGILRAEYDLDQGRYSESIVAGTTCGELPFFSETVRTAAVIAEKDTTVWSMTGDDWSMLREAHPQIAIELLHISMKLTSERMAAIISYVLTIAG